jgi:hypothetical protein
VEKAPNTSRAYEHEQEGITLHQQYAYAYALWLHFAGECEDKKHDEKSLHE